MKPSQRVFINTMAQYGRTIINMVLSLYTVRLVLASLGQSDYGLYSLVAGVVAMLAFITNSLVGTTQRFVSFYLGKGDDNKTKKVFNNCLVVHLLLGAIVVLCLIVLAPVFFDGFLNIPEGRESAAVEVYYLVAFMLFFTFVTSPYKALLTSHENIIYLSIVEIADALLKVILVLIMSVSDLDKLVFYAYIMFGIQCFNFLALSIYCYIKYSECSYPDVRKIDKSFLLELFTFAGWRIYGTLCISIRQQGIAIFLNKIYGTIMNAAWGIGSQLSGYTQLLSSSVVNAITPQIIKAEGGGDRKRTIFLSNILSKITFFLMSLIGIPFLFEVDAILGLWLGTPPEDAAFFSKLFIISLLIDSMTIGLTHMNNAIGKIGFYTFVMTTPKMLVFVFLFVCLKTDVYTLQGLFFIYIAIEAFCAFIRIPLIGRQAGFRTQDFMEDVILREVFPICFSVATCWVCVNIGDFSLRFVLTIMLSSIVYIIAFYFFGFSKRERGMFNDLFASLVSKVRR
ncbi:MAG: oligosaccharide flippase family protein [Bacteroidaceae bacterium]|nr:oligosaccharide flippase family protein [Bacteroidaceae bacterium]